MADVPPRLGAALRDPALSPPYAASPLADPETATDFAAARVPCPTCGTMLDAGRGHCFGCGRTAAVAAPAEALEALRRHARTAYLLMGLSLFIAVPAVAALVVVYAYRGSARGTWLDSHGEWQVETLWGVFWMGAAVLAATWLGGRFLGTGEWLLLAGLPALAWYAHRIAKGWTRLADGEPVTE